MTNHESHGSRSSLSLAAYVNADRMMVLDDISGGAIAALCETHSLIGSDLPGDVVIIQYSRPHADELIEAYLRHRPEVAMLVLGDGLSAATVRILAKFWAFDVISPSAEVPELLDSAARLARFLLDSRDPVRTSREPERESGGAAFWGFLGCVGGAGTTTVAVETAFALTRTRSDLRTVIIDLNLQMGMAASRLDGAPLLDLDAVAAEPGRLDAALLENYTWCHAGGVHLIAAPRNLRLDEQRMDAAVLALLDLASAEFDHVIIDLPRHRLPWSDAVHAAVDELVIVSELTVPSLQLAADYCRDLDSLRSEQAPARLLLNRMYARRSHRHGFSVSRAEDAIGRRIDYQVRSDWEPARLASDMGVPVVDIRARSPLVRDIEAVVDQLGASIGLSMAYEDVA